MSENKNKLTAVVVNDDTTQLGILVALTRKADLNPLPFTRADEALNAMNPENLPDIIITDIYMPGLDGWRFCRLLRSPEYAFCNNIPILVVSATFAGDHPERVATDIGANAFMSAPVNGKDFIAQIKALLSGKDARRRPRALIVEDSKTLAGLLKKTFASHGYQADTAFTAREANAVFGKTHYELAVLDYHLPDGTGDCLLDAFRVRRPDCICIMMTTDPTPELALDWMKRGASAYLRKPFETEFLIEISARAQRERALLRTKDLLEVRTRELQERQRQLIQADKLASLGVMAAGFAHEINNPANNIMLAATLLRDAMPDILSALDNHYQWNDGGTLGGLPYADMRDCLPQMIQDIVESCERISGIARDIGDATPTDGELNHARIDANKAVHRAIRMCGHMGRNFQGRLRTSLAEHLPAVTGDARRLEQVLINLLQNAWQSLENAEAGIDVATGFDAEAGLVCIQVHDEGRGMTPEALDMVKDPFFTTRRDQGGTGLSLFISHGIVEEMGGSLSFKSKEGQGTVASIRLPMADHEDNAARASPGRGAHVFRGYERTDDDYGDDKGRRWDSSSRYP